ncbi:hypothetical protein [Alcanivorax sp. S71-1-4]|uniref:hypothetical protein n=1 Tax=Alcanivorax sp. S71-1-4 TaxID=1177159 RepID=UPI001359A317|nr:hypothetical protein [Alcanivorax sp. S71-1-4]
MPSSDTCSPCWGARTELRAGRYRGYALLILLAVAAWAALANGLPWWCRGVLLLTVLPLLMMGWRRQPRALALTLWPDALAVECADGRRLLLDPPWRAAFWPGCVRVGPVVLYRDQMSDAVWRRLCAVLKN